MSKVIWLPEALTDLVRLFDFLKLKNESIAFQAAQAIREAGFSLASSDRPPAPCPLPLSPMHL